MLCSLYSVHALTELSSKIVDAIGEHMEPVVDKIHLQSNKFAMIVECKYTAQIYRRLKTKWKPC